MLALAWKRDHQWLDLTWDAIREHLGINAIVRLADPKLENLPSLIRFLLVDYLEMLPGYRKEAGAAQAASFRHGHRRGRRLDHGSDDREKTLDSKDHTTEGECDEAKPASPTSTMVFMRAAESE